MPVSRERRAHAIAASALACLTMAVEEWMRAGGRKPVGERLDTAIAAVRD